MTGSIVPFEMGLFNYLLLGLIGLIGLISLIVLIDRRVSSYNQQTMHEGTDTTTAPVELSARTRASNLERMRGDIFDLAIVGGGITGAGVALDAVSRGLHVALIEKRDFASGTSSRSSKLIHGGLRYLEHFELSLVRESLHERAVLSRIAPHLSKPLEFLVPVYNSTERSPLGSNKLRLSLGLSLYDLLAGRRNVGSHRWLSPQAALKLSPRLDPQGLRGAFVYYDCLTDDARLVIEVIKTAAAGGAAVANYVSAIGLTRDAGGVYVVRIDEEIGSTSLELRARLVVNATGVWSDEVARLSDARASKRLRPSKGIHIVVPSEKLQNGAAVLIPSLGEGRFLFVIPWHGRTVIGTTDTDYEGSLDNPTAETDEIERVVQSAARAFPEARLSSADVISTFAGLRPLINSGGQSTKELSRKEEIFEDALGLITITGGKLTTWRRMAERVVDFACRRLNDAEGNGKELRHSLTEKIELTGRPASGDSHDEGQRVAAELSADPGTVEHLMATYGGNYRVLLKLAQEDPTLHRVLVDGLPHIEAEVIYAAQYEMALTVEDFLSRRTRIDLLAPDHGHSCAERVANRIGIQSPL